MLKLNYITNLLLKNQSGGWGGINYRIYGELSKYFNLVLCEGINPSPVLHERILSKIRRSLGFKGVFFFFSKRRLDLIASNVEQCKDNSVDLNFFFGATPWIHYRSSKPYAVYLDASFRTYLNIYSKPDEFIEDDIDRICNEEKVWLKHASLIFWGSNWALNEAAKQYGFDPTSKRHLVINTGGNVPIPDQIQFGDFSELNLLFISLNFEKKGGYICYRAFSLLKQTFPMIKLIIIGERPPDEVIETENVLYAGLLDKNVPEQLALLTKYLRSGSFLVHPTKMDTMGAVIIEAGYYGCPSIAPNQFGIPDLIIDGKTGFLIEKLDPEIIVAIIAKTFLNKEYYLKLRSDCHAYYSTTFSWPAIGQRMVDLINAEK